MRSRSSRGRMSTRRRRRLKGRLPTGACYVRRCRTAMPFLLRPHCMLQCIVTMEHRHDCVACRAYEAVKAHQLAEAARRAEEERLTNLLYAEEVEVRAVSSAYCA